MQIWQGHAMTPGMVLRMVPQSWTWTAADVEDPATLSRRMGEAQIRWWAETFGVRQGWLEGDGGLIYDWPMGYKWPQRFVEELGRRGWVDDELEMTVLAAGYRRGDAGIGDPFVIVFSHPIVSWDDGREEVRGYLVFDGEMNGQRWPCVMDALVLTRWMHEKVRRHAAVRIVPRTRKQVVGVAEGRAIPGPLIPHNIGGFDQLQDRVVAYQTPQGVRVPAPAAGLEQVLEYGREAGLLGAVALTE